MRHEWFTAWTDQYLGVNVMLARAANMTDSAVFAAFDADPTTVQVLSFDRADDDPDTFRVRIGRCDGWLYAVEHFTGRGASDDVLERLSHDDGQTFALWCTQEVVSFQSADDGRVTARFDLGLPHYRYGVDPDRHLDEMAQAGLMSNNGLLLAARGAYLLELVTGVELTPAMLEAPLVSAVLRRAL